MKVSNWPGGECGFYSRRVTSRKYQRSTVYYSSNLKLKRNIPTAPHLCVWVSVCVCAFIYSLNYVFIYLFVHLFYSFIHSFQAGNLPSHFKQNKLKNRRELILKIYGPKKWKSFWKSSPLQITNLNYKRGTACLQYW